MNVLLTGATGFIGKYLVEELSERHRVFAVARKTDRMKNDSAVWLESDFADPGAGLSFPEKMDAVVFLAQSRAYHDFPETALDIFRVNIGAVMLVLDLAVRTGVSKFIYASSGNIYGCSHKRIDENVVAEPASFYGKSKFIAEMLIESYAPFIKCSILRLFTVYGRGQRHMLIPTLVNCVRRNQPIRIQGKQGLSLSPIYIHDVVDVIKAILESDDNSPGYDIFNVGGDEVLSIREIADVIGRALNVTPIFEFVGGEDPGCLAADSSKLKKTFRLGKFISLYDGIRRIVG